MFLRKTAVQTSGILRVAYMHAVSSRPDLPIGYIGLSLGPQDRRGHGRRQRGAGSGCPAHPFEFCAPPFHVWSPEQPRSCRIAKRSCI